MIEIKVRMKSGKEYEFIIKQNVTLDEIIRDMNRNNFVRFGKMGLNIHEIESVEEKE